MISNWLGTPLRVVIFFVAVLVLCFVFDKILTAMFGGKKENENREEEPQEHEEPIDELDIEVSKPFATTELPKSENDNDDGMFKRI